MKKIKNTAAVLFALILMASSLASSAFAATTKTTEITNNRFAITVDRELTCDETVIDYFYSEDDEVYYNFCVTENTDAVNVAKMTDDEVKSYFDKYFSNYFIEYDNKTTKKDVGNGCNYILCEASDDDNYTKDVYAIFTTKNYVYEISLTVYENTAKEIKIFTDSLDSFSMNDEHFAEDVEKKPFDFTVDGLDQFVVSEDYADFGEDLKTVMPVVSEVLKIGIIISIVFSLGGFILFLVLMITFIKKYTKNKKELDEYKRRYPPVNAYPNYSQPNYGAPNPPRYAPPQSGTYYNAPQNAPSGFNQPPKAENNVGTSPDTQNAAESPVQPENAVETPTEENK